MSVIEQLLDQHRRICRASEEPAKRPVEKTALRARRFRVVKVTAGHRKEVAWGLPSDDGLLGHVRRKMETHKPNTDGAPYFEIDEIFTEGENE